MGNEKFAISSDPSPVLVQLILASSTEWSACRPCPSLGISGGICVSGRLQVRTLISGVIWLDRRLVLRIRAGSSLRHFPRSASWIICPH